MTLIPRGRQGRLQEDDAQTTDGATSEIREALVFVAVLGASNCISLEATSSQRLPNWIGSHVRTLAFFGVRTEFWDPLPAHRRAQGIAPQAGR